MNDNPTENPSPASRTQYVQELRALHQKRHASRHGQYASEEREEQYEKAIRQVGGTL